MIIKRVKKIHTVFIILSIVNGFIISCKCNREDKKKDDIKELKMSIDTSVLVDQKNYIDPETGEMSVIVFKPGGKPVYKKEKVEKIFNETKSGLQFKFIKTSKKEKRPNVGDVIYINMSYKTEKDSVLFRTIDVDKEFKMRLAPPSHEGGCIEEAFMLMNEGDSAIFRIDAYNFFTKTQGKLKLPEGIKKGDKLIFNIKMEKIVSGAEFVQQNKDLYNYYIQQENSLIERYLLNFNKPVEKKSSGLRIVTIKNGSGKKVKIGNKVKIHYTVGYIDGGIFYSTLDKNEPFVFSVGKSEVIDGLDEAVLDMNVGDVKLAIIPFRLAYGDQKYGEIPPFSTLVFEIELLAAY